MKRTLLSVTALLLFNMAFCQLFSDVKQDTLWRKGKDRYTKGWVFSVSGGILTADPGSLKYTQTVNKFSTPDFTGPSVQTSYDGVSGYGDASGFGADISAMYRYRKWAAGLSYTWQTFNGSVLVGDSQRVRIPSSVRVGSLNLVTRYTIKIYGNLQLLAGLKAGYPAWLYTSLEENVSPRFNYGGELGLIAKVSSRMHLSVIIGYNAVSYRYNEFNYPTAYSSGKDLWAGTSQTSSYRFTANKGFIQTNGILDAKIGLSYYMNSLIK